MPGTDIRIGLPSTITMDEDDHFQVNFNKFKETLSNFQSDAIDYLYDVEPQSQNLFWAGEFKEADGRTAAIKPFYNAAYRIRKITIPGMSLEVEQHPESKAPMFKNVNYKQEITIDWFEDVYHSVQKYHLDWVARWYNRHYDVLRCGIQGKFRKVTVVAFHYRNSASTSIVEIPEVQPLMAFQIGGLIRTSLPDMSFDYSADGNDQVLSITYKCGAIYWLYGNEIGVKDNKLSLFTGAGTLDDQTIQIWNPDGGSYMPDSTGEVSAPVDSELIRIARAATSYQVGEGAIG